MHRRIQELHYDSVDAFASDAELVFSNAIRYNRHDTVWHRAAVRLRRTLPALVREAKRKCDELGSTTIAHFAPEEVRERFDAALFDYTLEVDECVASDPAGPAPVPSR
ncbi:MAG: hypothetical protein BJ554DRAFT_893 [Olpidium bornovanus]|uniref:Bromo domain-containing protein n=1 Tax=Olpidium bornovanus TaxID=278681 RepID=A0A8H8DHQ8_9FUNG|nr:MAG: hypothetical protein BJ554DRAFT_893 [Olpidium bornovanus]